VRNGTFPVLGAGATFGPMATPPKSEEEVKTLDREERQVELDAIALYGNSQEFPSVANSFVHEEPSASRLDPASSEAVS
jgi:hypothetical protein